MLPLLPFVFATFPTATFKCQSAVRCSARATKLDSLLLRSQQSFPAVQTFFPKFYRAMRVQSSTSLRTFRIRACARAYSYARVLAVRDNGRGKLHLHRARVRCGYTHMFAVASRDVCPFTYPRVFILVLSSGHAAAGASKHSTPWINTRNSYCNLCRLKAHSILLFT